MKTKFFMLIVIISICVLVLSQPNLSAQLVYDRLDFPAGNSPHSVAIGGLDGDGAPDLAVANTLNDIVSVLLGNGDGTFQSAVSYGVGGGPVSVAIGNLDGDLTRITRYCSLRRLLYEYLLTLRDSSDPCLAIGN